jgi:hypothetical protein
MSLSNTCLVGWRPVQRSPRPVCANIVAVAITLSLMAMALRPPAVAGDPARLAAIISNVESQEALYADLEAKWTLAIRKEHVPGDPPNVVDSATVEFRGVRQKGMEYLNVVGSGTSVDGNPIDPDFTLGYDGQLLRSYRHSGKIGNIRQRHDIDSRLFTPHTIVLEHHSLRVPLSVLLKGDDAIKAHPGGRNFSPDRIEVSYLGDETWNGMPCNKVELDYVDRKATKRTVNSRSIFWLAPQRNYVLVKHEGYNPVVDSDVIPVEVGTVTEMRELAKGIWMPFAVTITIFSQIAARENRLVESEHKIITVASATLTPNYPLDLFRDIRFPDGAIVYNVDQEGRITSSYQMGAPLDPGVKATGGRWRWWVMSNIVLVTVVVSLLIWRRRRRGRVAVRS